MHRALRSRFAPSHGSGSTPKTFPRNIFSAQDDSVGRLHKFSEYKVLQVSCYHKIVQTVENTTKYIYTKKAVEKVNYINIDFENPTFYCLFGFRVSTHPPLRGPPSLSREGKVFKSFLSFKTEFKLEFKADNLS